MRLKVEVTPELVERATQRDSRHCMIAEAIKHQRPEYERIMVDLATIRWTNPRTGKRYICLTPEAAAQALVDFDQGRPIEPFSFNVEPIQTTPASAPRGRKKLTNGGKIEGGKPIRQGHLRGDVTSRPDVLDRRAAAREAQLAQPTGDESNTQLSSPHYRQYGRRLLRA
jgi:hypothetical protein